jgi:site-specific DNA-methyltransferase (adenine-specific)
MDWETPQWLFDKLYNEFEFHLDVCASDSNHKCNTYITEDKDSLSWGWKDYVLASEGYVSPTLSCWMNPPYGRGIDVWMKKAYEESFKGCIVVCLVPARTDTNWWWKYALQAYEIRFIKGRLKFGGADNCAPFPSAIIIFNKCKGIEVPNIIWWDIKNE